ncbi:MAG: helix-turn-helix domain-containing protein [Verrucomicrobiales bacterium]
MSQKRRTVRDLKTGELKPVWKEHSIVLNSPSSWNGFFLNAAQNPQVEVDQVVSTDYVFFLQTGAPLSLEFKSDGAVTRKTINPGQVSFIPAHVTFSSRTETSGMVVALILEKDFIYNTSAELGDVLKNDLHCLHGVDDPLARELMTSIHHEAQNSAPEGGMYAEFLATTITGHLLHRYQNLTLEEGRSGKGLPKFTLRKVLEFINDHLAHEMTLKQLASVAQMSPFYFSRMFKLSTGFSPHEYVTRRRVYKAKDLFTGKYESITQVATEVGFYDQSHLSRHFRKVIGISPGQFLRSFGRQREV